MALEPYTAREPRVCLEPRGGAVQVLPFQPEPFDRARLAARVSKPVVIAPVAPDVLGRYPRCLNLPIKLAGAKEYWLPGEWAGLRPLLEVVVDAEQAANPALDDFYAYLTVDCSFVEAGEHQREPGCHLDGYQGAAIQPKTAVARNYVAVSNGPTVFYDQLFSIAHLDDAVYNVFTALDRQKRPEAARPIAELTLYAFDGYAVHEAGAATRTGLRTFVRVTYELERYDRLGFSINSLLPVSWPQVDRDFLATLLEPPE